MEKKEVVLYLVGEFVGIYGWGTGWESGKKTIWDNYWHNIKDIYWHLTPGVGSGSCDTLVTTTGSIYLHPMRFDAVLKGCGVTCDGKYLSSEIEHLKKLCEKCAEATGSHFNLYTSDEIVCDFGKLNKVA